MQIKRALLAAVLCGSLVGVVGCKDDKSNTGPVTVTGGQAAVAVVDLNKVYTDLNYLATINGKVQSYQATLAKQLTEVNTRYVAEINAYVKSVKPKNVSDDEKFTLTQDQSQHLNQLYSNAQRVVSELDQKGGQALVQYRDAWVGQYRTQLQPVIRKVAEGKKISMVVTKTNDVLFNEAALDVSDAVVDATTAHPLTVVEPPMPPIQAPETIPMQAAGAAGSTTKPTTKP